MRSEAVRVHGLKHDAPNALLCVMHAAALPLSLSDKG